MTVDIAAGEYRFTASPQHRPARPRPRASAPRSWPRRPAPLGRSAPRPRATASVTPADGPSFEPSTREASGRPDGPGDLQRPPRPGRHAASTSSNVALAGCGQTQGGAGSSSPGGELPAGEPRRPEPRGHRFRPHLPGHGKTLGPQEAHARFARVAPRSGAGRRPGRTTAQRRTTRAARAEVRLFRDGRLVDEPALIDFIEMRPGQPLSMRQFRESLTTCSASASSSTSGPVPPPWRRASACATTWCRSAARAGWRCSTPSAAPSRRRRPSSGAGWEAGWPPIRSTPPRPFSTSTIATRAGSRRASRRGRRRRTAGSLSTSTRVRPRIAALRSARSSHPSGRRRRGGRCRGRWRRARPAG